MFRCVVTVPSFDFAEAIQRLMPDADRSGGKAVQIVLSMHIELSKAALRAGTSPRQSRAPFSCVLSPAIATTKNQLAFLQVSGR